MTQTHPMALLAGGIPITLILDLADPGHLPSRTIMHRERGNADWLPTRAATVPAQPHRG